MKRNSILIKAGEITKANATNLAKIGMRTLTFRRSKKNKATPSAHISTLFYSFSCFLLRILASILFAYRSQHNFAEKELKGPSIVIAPHSSLLDPVFVMLCMGPKHKLHFVAGNFLQEGHGFLPWLTAKMKTINITQFNSDFLAVKQMISLLRSGESIAIFPEGERSADGRHELFSDAFIKLVQRSHANLIFCDLDGAFLSWPRWSGYHGLRLGKIVVTASLVYTGEETGELELEDIRTKMTELLRGTDYHNQLERRNKGQKTYSYFSFNPAGGLDNLLYSCPNCQEFLSMYQLNRTAIMCSLCNFKAELGKDGLFKQAINFPAIGKIKIGTSTNPIVWHMWQIRHTSVRYLKELAPDYLFPSSGNCTIETFDSQHHADLIAKDALSYLALDWAGEKPRFTFAFQADLPAETAAEFQQDLTLPNARSAYMTTTESERQINNLIQVTPQHFVYEDIKTYLQFWHKNYRITYYPNDVKLVYVYRDLIEGLGQPDLDPRLARCHVDDAKDLINDYKILRQKLKKE